jgi:hypothetical protein
LIGTESTLSRCGTDGQACVFGGADGGHVFFVVVGGADIAVVAAGRFQIVMIAEQSGGFEVAGPVRVEQSQRGARVNARIPNLPDGFQNFGPFLFGSDAFPAGDDAEELRPVFPGLFGFGDHLFGRLERVNGRGSVVAPGLRAETAVFGALAGLGVGNRAKNNFFSFKAFPNFEGRGANTPGGRASLNKELQGFGFPNALSFQGLIFQGIDQIHVLFTWFLCGLKSGKAIRPSFINGNLPRLPADR